MRTPDWQSDDGAIQLHCCDCLDLLPTIAEVDITLTSPPYNVSLPYVGHSDNMTHEDFCAFNAKWVLGIFNASAERSRAYIIVSDKMLFDMKPAAEAAGWTFGQILTWCKPNLAGGSGAITGDWNFLTEHIMLFRKGKRTAMLNGEGNTHSYFVIPSPQRNWNEERKQHVAQYPIELCCRLLSRTPGEKVLDPFMGSGTTGVACVRTGRKFVGIEREPSYFDIAVRRIKAELAQPRLFTAPEPVQEQASMFV